jgi:hypothetical protein
MSNPSSSQLAVLPVWPIAREAFASVWSHRVNALKISWAWVLAWVVLGLLLVPTLPREGQIPSATFFLVLFLLLGALVVGFASIAVAWHRLMLLGERLLAECEQRGLEGIVSKLKDQPYRSGKCDWVKVKMKAWREANKERGDLFYEPKRR